MSRSTLIAILFSLIATTTASIASAAEPASLDDLLEQTKTVQQREDQVNAEREATFKAQHDKQAALMATAQAELSTQKKRGADLSSSFDANEKKIGELQAQLEARSGNLGEMFGIVRQVSNDFSSVVRNSIISAQFPDREEFITKLAQSKELPSTQDLQRFWFELQREMTESGKVVRFKSKVIAPSGAPSDAPVVRVGPFSATTGGKYLNYLANEKQFAIMARQPGSAFESPAEKLEAAHSGYVKSVLDPTRGPMLTIYSLRPNLLERIEKGHAVGYIILAVGFIGAALAIYQVIYLTLVRIKVRSQLENLEQPNPDNPLGRVLGTFRGDETRLKEDAEIVELRISEAVLKEVPNLERFQAFLRLAVSAGPLLGLIGTVVGMIITFQSITESGSSDPKLMAAGISQAMIATVLGLGIAIPLLFANAWLTSMSRSVMQILDEQSTGILAGRMEEGAHHA
ncbi:MAG: MotA/TolQ/ExbB proton channel family protein [Nevskia sp.]|nr:MotA/TolQ/ExbB proton channel family protein [Nevskia sp.]